MRDTILVYASVMVGWRSRSLLGLIRDRRAKGQRLTTNQWFAIGVLAVLVAAIAVVLAA